MSRKLFKNGYKIDLDENYLLRGDKSTMSNYIKSLVDGGILSINEGRELLGYDRIENGDEHRVAFSDVSQNSIEQNGKDKNTQNEDENGQGN